MQSFVLLPIFGNKLFINVRIVSKYKPLHLEEEQNEIEKDFTADPTDEEITPVLGEGRGLKEIVKDIAMPLMVIVVSALALFGLYGSGEYVFFPTDEQAVTELDSLEAFLDDGNILDRSYPGTNLYSPVGILSLNSDIAFGEMLYGGDDKMKGLRKGITAHNLIFLVGSSICSIIILLLTGFGRERIFWTVGMVIFMPLAVTASPMLAARPYFLMGFWQLATLAALVGYLRYKKDLLLPLVFIFTLMGMLSHFSSFFGILGILGVLSLKSKRKSYKKSGVVIGLAAGIYILLRMISDVELPSLFGGENIVDAVATLGYFVFLTDMLNKPDILEYMWTVGGLGMILLFIGVGLKGYLKGNFEISGGSNEEKGKLKSFLYLAIGLSMASDVVFLLLETIKVSEFIADRQFFICIAALSIKLPVLALLLQNEGRIRISKLAFGLYAGILSLLLYSKAEHFETEEAILVGMELEEGSLSKYYLNRATNRIENGDYPEAYSDIISAEKYGAEGSELLRARGFYHAKTQDFIAARKYLTEYLEKERSRDKEAALLLANVHIIFDSLDVAEKAVDKTLRFHSKDAEAISLKSAILLKKGKFREAATLARLLLANEEQVNFLAIEFYRYGNSKFEEDDNIALECWDLAGLLDMTYIPPYERFLIYYISYYPDFRRALACVKEIEARGGEVKPEIMAQIYKITPPALRPELSKEMTDAELEEKDSGDFGPSPFEFGEEE
ncbi:MAG: hypothetical protein Kapaf2KO_14860 [Candidatus Kapaibacteriales bacterium]